jgi:hypothetical protein
MSNRQRRRPDNDNFRQRDPTTWLLIIVVGLATALALGLINHYL